jgi:putative molybdopterin biosynthesis protein
VGSLGGLLALARDEAHLAGSHLLDETTGEYNFPFLEQYLGGKKVTLVNLVYRDQGFIVPPGNPKGIGDFTELTRPDILYINRQRGAGTRILLDIELNRRGIDPSSVRGYNREEFTHTGVAAAVAGGTADVGLGLLSAARALELDFVPVTRERYDLIIPDVYLDSEPIRRVLEVVRSQEFRDLAHSLGGYDASQAGQVLVRPEERGS